MKLSVLMIAGLFTFLTMDKPKHTGLANVIVVNTITQNILGKNVGYIVKFKNYNIVEVDAIKWKAFFYDNFEELKGESEGKWSSGNFIKPIKKGETTEDVETAWVKDASKVIIKITKVHFVNGKIYGK